MGAHGLPVFATGDGMNLAILAQDIHISLLDMNDAHEVARYDGFVRAHPDSTPYHLSHWGRAVEKALRHRCCYLINLSIAMFSAISSIWN